MKKNMVHTRDEKGKYNIGGKTRTQERKKEKTGHR